MIEKNYILDSASICKYSWSELLDKFEPEVFVRRLQLRIVKAVKQNRWGKVKYLSRLLTNSFQAKLLAIKRVTSNKGAKTPGIDGITWTKDADKINALSKLSRKKYKPLPLRRIYIPKKDKTKLRPLSIPTMTDRAMQALHLACPRTHSRNSIGLKFLWFQEISLLPRCYRKVLQCIISQIRCHLGLRSRH